MKREVSLVGYSLHGRSRDGVIDYVALFDTLLGLTPLTSQQEIGNQIVAIAEAVASDNGAVALRYVAGYPEQGSLLFDPATGALDEVDFERRFIANSAWFVAEPSQRVASLERRRPGVAGAIISAHIERVLSEVSSLRSPSFDLNPIPSKSLLDALDQLERIREARVTLARPNYDWTDNADELSELGDESMAGQMEIGAKAPRGESLAPRTGIVGAIRSLLNQAVGPIKDFRVMGTRVGEHKERTISLEHNAERRFVSIDPSESESEQVMNASTQFVSELEPLPEDREEG